MEVVGVIQARMGSTRLPRKVLMEIEGEPLLGHIIGRLKTISGLDTIIVATSTSPADKAVVEVAERYGVGNFLGSEEDVLARFVGAIKNLEAETVLRATGDNPFVDPKISQELILKHIESNADYTAMEGLPLGVAPEVVSKKALLSVNSLLDKESPHREHVTSFIKIHPDLFKIQMLEAPPHLARPNWRLTVDTREDLKLIREIFLRLWRPGKIITLVDIIRLLETNPHLAEMNAHIIQRVVDGE